VPFPGLKKISQSDDALRTYTIVGQNDSEVGWLSAESRRKIHN